MSDLYFDEDNIVHMLMAPVNVDTIDYIQTATAQALCDLYDRKVTREEFVNMAGPCLALYAQTARLRLMHSVEAAFQDSGITQDTLNIAKEGITSLITKQRDTVIGIVRRLQECPTSEDVVH